MIKLETIKVDNTADPTGTCLQAEMYNLSFYILKKLFGKHKTSSQGSKTDAEWYIQTPFGIGTVYNYKDGKNYCGKKNGLALKDITEWHIGGGNKETALIIKTAIEAFQAGYGNCIN